MGEWVYPLWEQMGLWCKQTPINAHQFTPINKGANKYPLLIPCTILLLHHLLIAPERNNMTTEKGRVFAYCRVSTTEQDTANQVHAIHQRGFRVAAARVITDEGVSGSVPAMQRPAFANMVNHKLEDGDTLIVLKLDRLGRDSIDVQQTINMLTEKKIKVHCLDLPVENLSSAEGKMMLQMIAAFAEFERNRIKERTREALARKKAEGVKLGRPVATDTTKAVQLCKQNGMTQSQAKEHLGVSIRTIKNHWNK